MKSGSTYYALSCDHVMKSEGSRRIVHPGHYDHFKYPKLRRSISKWGTSSLLPWRPNRKGLKGACASNRGQGVLQQMGILDR